uniref:Uncharacterized protein n=1 Tax=Chromera velia CCMP2878 TaxID=1169474 RepID=A0A0G4ICE6_9ALVE|eukprot:Cvel_13129.t1-p1 / transcript=Cvel_13129.t1 / gene=Cvel_13129 / organism=Chromera_velia_CCMP2878 / gene_product=hypothetical protein / transcript_product=hypothetical protein / location=Cvel_scaffold885:22795-24375(-) / protein_length=281 / sequence_SO=supercontig / SO=protein_coding / is_pseudo=false
MFPIVNQPKTLDLDGMLSQSVASSPPLFHSLPQAVTLATIYAFGLSILYQQSAAESMIASLAVVMTLLSQINWLDCIVQATLIGFAVALHLLLYTLCAFASCVAIIISAVVKTGFEFGVIALEATTFVWKAAWISLEAAFLGDKVQQAGLQGHRPPPPDLEARHLLARIGGFGGDVNRAVHSIEGNIPSREGDNNQRDRHGGESDREDEEPWTQGEPIEPDELSPRTRPPIAPSRIDPETHFAQHPHPIQRWSNPVLAVTAPQLATLEAQQAPRQAAGGTR